MPASFIIYSLMEPGSSSGESLVKQYPLLNEANIEHWIFHLGPLLPCIVHSIFLTQHSISVLVRVEENEKTYHGNIFFAVHIFNFFLTFQVCWNVGIWSSRCQFSAWDLKYHNIWHSFNFLQTLFQPFWENCIFTTVKLRVISQHLLTL